MALRADHVDLDRDRALVHRFQAGDGGAFDELYCRYHDRLERFCLKRVGNQHTAEELAQEAFTRALAALPAFGGDCHFYAWVTVIASRLCVDYHRRQARTAVITAPDPTAVPGGQDEIVDAVDDAIVIEAMARLGPRHQDVLHLREVEGWSYRRIANHYGVPVGTVETLLFRARRALRREFRVIDGAGLAAVPILGWLVHSVARARDRLAPMASLSDAPAALAAAGAAAATAVAVVVIPGVDRPPPPTPHPPPAATAALPVRRTPATTVPKADAAVPKPAAAVLPPIPPDDVSGSPSPAAVTGTAVDSNGLGSTLSTDPPAAKPPTAAAAEAAQPPATVPLLPLAAAPGVDPSIGITTPSPGGVVQQLAGPGTVDSTAGKVLGLVPAALSPVTAPTTTPASSPQAPGGAGGPLPDLVGGLVQSR